MRAWSSAAILLAVLVAEVWLTVAAPASFPGGFVVPEPRAAQVAGPSLGGYPGLTQDYAGLALARPLFSVSRRPPAGSATPSGAASGEPLPRLSGVIITASQKQAIFQDSDRSLVRTVGSDIGKYRIVNVELSQVTLTGPNGAKTIKPAYDDASPVATPPSSIIGKLNSGTFMTVPVPPPPTLGQIMSGLPTEPKR